MGNLDLSKFVLKFLRENSRAANLPLGLYEIWDYEGTLDLADPSGQTAIFRKHLRVKFLEDEIVAICDHVWGDGKALSAYICYPGVLADIYREGDRWSVLISLRQAKQSGSFQDYQIERLIEDGFTHSEEWWQMEMYHPVRRLQFSILFPHSRSCEQATIVEKESGKTTVFEPGQFTRESDGRQRLTFETHSARRFETYTIKWRW